MSARLRRGRHATPRVRLRRWVRSALLFQIDHLGAHLPQGSDLCPGPWPGPPLARLPVSRHNSGCPSHWGAPSLMAAQDPEDLGAVTLTWHTPLPCGTCGPRAVPRPHPFVTAWLIWLFVPTLRCSLSDDRPGPRRPWGSDAYVTHPPSPAARAAGPLAVPRPHPFVTAWRVWLFVPMCLTQGPALLGHGKHCLMNGWAPAACASSQVASSTNRKASLEFVHQP